MESLFYSVLSLSAVGVLSAIILYFVAQKFKVVEDPRIDELNDLLPSANCGGCGYAGCRNFAEEIIKSGKLEGFYCPAGGNDLMKSIATYMGVEAIVSEPKIAVVRCNGSKENAKPKNNYDGAKSCAVAHSLYAGESGCSYGCLGLGDCVKSCQFDAMVMDYNIGLPIIDQDKCIACNACVIECPRSIIELRNKGKKDRRIYVSCISQEKGAAAKKNCDVACIGCKKCQKACTFEAITVENFIAYIDFEKCKLCRKCQPECPTGSIIELNFPPRKVKEIKEDNINSEELVK